MRILCKFLKWVIGLIVLIVVVVYIFNLHYLVTAVKSTLLKGHSTAFLQDYRHLPTRVVANDTISTPWSVSGSYNKVAPTRDLVKMHEDLKTTAFLVIKQDSIWHEAYYDNYDKNTIGNFFSVSKSIVVAALGKALELGYIGSLEDKVKDYLPSLQGAYSDSLKVIDLARMSSGLEWEESYYSPFSITTQAYFDRDLRSVMLSLDIVDLPGKEFVYKSGDTQLLAMVLQESTKQNLSSFVSEYFWKPMGAENPALWQLDHKGTGIEKAFCCFTSNARDLARFGKLYLNHGNWNGRQILDSVFIQRSISPGLASNPEYGLGWWLVNYNNIDYYYMRGHLGQFVIVDPLNELIIVRLGHIKGQQTLEDPHSEDLYEYINEVNNMLRNQNVK